MYYYDLVVAFTAGFIGLPTVHAKVPHVQSLGAVTILSDNDLAGNLTTKTAGALLLEASTYSTAVQRCASLNEKVLSPSNLTFPSGLNNALKYQDFLNPTNNPRQYWISSSPSTNTNTNTNKCSTITSNGTVMLKSCEDVAPVLCTNSAPLLSANQSDTRLGLRVTVKSGAQHFTGFRDFYTWQFRGIRFAAQPKRFTFSTLYKGSGEVTATKYGPGCLQAPDPRWPELSEDCLFLNVWTPQLPARSPSKKLKAVMVWIFGGGNTAGTGTDPEKEGGSLASRGDVVVVTFNYRVGTLGFLAFDDGVHTGNYAISDMLTALRWVQKNIENFGGDPKRVTIWGESAGALNVRTLLGVPEAEQEGLFHGAIMQSMTGEAIGPESAAAQYDTPSALFASTTKKIIAESGCSDSTSALECLRSYDPLKWATEPGRTQAKYPTRDNKLIFTRALPLAGPLSHHHNIPIMLGTVRDEFSYLLPAPTTNFTSRLEQISNAVGKDLLYLANSSFSPETLPSWPSLTKAEKEAAVFNATSRLTADFYFACLTHAFHYSAVKNKVFTQAYGFEFNRTYQPDRFGDAARPICGRDVSSADQQEYYKCHGGDVPYTFGNILQQGWPDRGGTDTPFARLVVDYWTAFVRTGSPRPEDGYLEARGYTDSKEKMIEAGAWSGDGKEIMRLQWSGIGKQAIDGDALCQAIGFGKDFYETYDYSGGGGEL